ncbi:MAG: hypothetical protein NUW00_02200 [Candidatus Kaiserbacteria bacterium]|nr:hypothetical protein [Candidatus Kaiserbacteria bacterium]
MKGKVRIGGALGVGVVIILGALVANSVGNETPVGAVVVSKAPERQYIASQDSDGDGVKDWEENLQGKVFETIPTPTSTSFTSGDEPYEPPTTLTGKFSEAFFQDYLQGKINGEDFSDPTAFIGNAVTAIEKNTESKKHSRNELNTVSDSPEAFHIYGNEFAKIMNSSVVSVENEAIILQQALTANDPTILEKLTPIHEAYVSYISQALVMEVPESFALLHVSALNTFESILTDVEAMRLAFTDPLYALARTKGYEDDAKALYESLQKINEKLSENNVSYTNDEPGVFFYLFDI